MDRPSILREFEGSGRFTRLYGMRVVVFNNFSNRSQCRIAPVWGGMQALLAERLVADVAWTVKWRPAAAKALVGYGSMH